MTARRTILKVVGLGVVAAALLSWPIESLIAARGRERLAGAALTEALRSERELVHLRSKVATALLARPPEGDVAAAVQAALREAGLSAQVLAEVTPQDSGLVSHTADRAAPKWRRQSVLVRLNAIPLPSLGGFMDRWRAAHPEWSISQIELQANEVRGADGTPTGNAVFAPRLTLLTSYVDWTEP